MIKPWLAERSEIERESYKAPKTEHGFHISGFTVSALIRPLAKTGESSKVRTFPRIKFRQPKKHRK